jgi:hypothetical protein
LINLVIFILSGFAFTIGSEAIGSYLLLKLGLPGAKSSFFHCFAAGSSIITLLLIIFGSIGLYQSPVLGCFWTILLVISAIRLFVRYPQWTEDVRYYSYNRNIVSTFTRIALGVFLLISLLSSMSPETRHDPYDYHLSVPNLYLEHGGIVEIPWHVFSYMPKNGEILYGAALAVGNDSVTKLIHYIFGLMIVLLIIHVTTNLMTLQIGLFAGLLVASMPLFGFLATSSYVDLMRAFWELIALYSLYQFWQEDSGKCKNRLLYLSGLYAGMALGTKYVSWLVFLPAYLVLFLLACNRGEKRVPVKVQVFASVFLMIPLLPWLLYNLIWTGNPVYPLLPQIFGYHIPPASEAYIFFRNHAPPSSIFGFPEFLTFLGTRVWMLTLDGNALFLIGVIALLSAPWWRKTSLDLTLPDGVFDAIRLYILMTSVFFLLGTDNRDGRFFFSTLALLAIPSAVFIYTLWQNLNSESALGHYLIPFLILFLTFNGLSYRYSQLEDQKETIFPVMFEESRHRWLNRHFPNYEDIQWANEHLPQDAYVMGMGYPLHRKNIYGIKYGYVPFLAEVGESVTADDLAEILKNAGITHLLQPYPVIHEIDFSILEDLHMKPVYRKKGVTIYQLRRDFDSQ